MNSRYLALTALTLVMVPGLSVAQTQTINVTGNVAPACTLGDPAAASLPLGNLTGPDGRLTAALASAAISAQTTFANAWCNTPSRITLTSSPLTTTPGFTFPSNFSNQIAFSANLVNWQAPVLNRASVANNPVSLNSPTAHAAAPLGITFSALAPLAGGAEAPTNFIVAGSYSATVSITLAVN